MVPAKLDQYGRVWYLPDEELCSECGQPDNSGDCDHEPLSEDDVRFLQGLDEGLDK